MVFYAFACAAINRHEATIDIRFDGPKRRKHQKTMIEAQLCLPSD